MKYLKNSIDYSNLILKSKNMNFIHENTILMRITSFNYNLQSIRQVEEDNINNKQGEKLNFFKLLTAWF